MLSTSITAMLILLLPNPMPAPNSITAHRALLQGLNKNTHEQLVARRKEMEAELRAVVKHKEELLERRAAAVKAIVRDHEARRQRVVDQLQNAPPQPSASSAASATAAVDGGASPGLPSPQMLLRRVQDLQREEQRKEMQQEQEQEQEQQQSSEARKA